MNGAAATQPEWVRHLRESFRIHQWLMVFEGILLCKTQVLYRPKKSSKGVRFTTDMVWNGTEERQEGFKFKARLG